MRRTPPQPLRQLHRWIGLAGGLLFLLVALSGAALVFRAQLEPVVSARLLVTPPCAAPVPLERLVEAARSAYPEAGRLSIIRLVDDPGRSARLRFSDGQWIHVDRCSARVLGAQPLYAGPFGTLSWLHIFGFTGHSDTMMRVTGTAFVVLLLAGLALWWPGGLASLRAGRGLAGAARDLNRHRRFGLYAAPVLLASALTGLLQAFSWGAAGPLAPPMSGAAATASTRHALSAILAQAEVLVPGATRIQIRLPSVSSTALSVEMVGRTAAHANAVDYAIFDSATGALVRHVPYAANTRAHQLYLLAAGIHYGWVGGPAAQLLLFLSALSVGVLAWTGTAAWLRMRKRASPARRQSARLRLCVARKTVEANGICSFELVAPAGKPLPRFAAGAHIDVQVAPGVVRQYSLCNHPRERHRYLIGVLHADNSRGGSRAMHEQLQAGDLLEVGFPRNHFPLRPDARRSLLFAGGIGITPLLSMAEQLASDGADFELHYHARSRERAAFVDRLLASPFAHRVHLHVGEGARTTLSTLLAAPAQGTHLYVCGPAGFTEAVIGAARAAGWEDTQLHREVFAGAADQAENTPFELRLAGSGRTIQVGPEQSALDALLAAGVPVPHSCRQGLCGACLTGIIEGEPEHRDQCLSMEERARNKSFTPCCSRARGGYLTLNL